MVANTTGEIFKVTTFGLSHGKALGATIDGCPAGLNLSNEDIQNELNKNPIQMSGGQKQRVACARALVTNPSLILADEPTGALDSKSSSEMLEQFEAINRMGQTILMVTHSTSAASHAKRVLFIKDGTVFHQIYRGDKSEQEMYESISLTLTRIQAGE